MPSGDQLIDQLEPYCYTDIMSAARKVTVNIPADILEEATRLTGKGITLTIVEGLQEIQRRARRSALRKLKGKVSFELNLQRSRQ